MRAPVVTADTNILISALEFGGRPRQFLILAEQGAVTLAVSEPILLETERVLRDKFGWMPDRWARARAALERFCLVVRPATRITAVDGDPDDDRMLECAVASNSQSLVSGDKHLLRLGVFEGIGIMSLGTFLDRHFPPPDTGPRQ